MVVEVVAEVAEEEVVAEEAEVEGAEVVAPQAKLQVKCPSHGIDCEVSHHNCLKETESSLTPS